MTPLALTTTTTLAVATLSIRGVYLFATTDDHADQSLVCMYVYVLDGWMDGNDLDDGYYVVLDMGCHADAPEW